MGLQLFASSSADTIDSLVVVISRISPLEVELMLSVSLSTDERASSSESYREQYNCSTRGSEKESLVVRRAAFRVFEASWSMRGRLLRVRACDSAYRSLISVGLIRNASMARDVTTSPMLAARLGVRRVSFHAVEDGGVSRSSHERHQGRK